MESGTLGADRDHNSFQFSSLQKNKGRQLPPRASYQLRHCVCGPRHCSLCVVCVGIAFCDNLDDILQYIGNPATQGYIIQKYIGTFCSVVETQILHVVKSGRFLELIFFIRLLVYRPITTEVWDDIGCPLYTLLCYHRKHSGKNHMNWNTFIVKIQEKV